MSVVPGNIKRIHSDLLLVCDGKEDEKQVAIMVPDPEDLFKLRGIIVSPPGAPTEGFSFFLDIRVPKDYPFKPPSIMFVNGIWHPKVRGDPRRQSHYNPICMAELRWYWSARFSLETIMVSIQSMLRNPGEGLNKSAEIVNSAANRQYLYDQVAYVKTAKEWAEKDNEGYGQIAFLDHRIAAIQSVLKVPGVINYEGHVFSTKEGTHTWKITVVITPNLILYREGVEGQYPIPNRHQQLKITGFHFEFESTLDREESIVIDVGEGTSRDRCWKITTVGTECNIRKRDVDSYVPRQNTPAVWELKMEWIRKERKPHRLIHKLHVKGTSPPFDAFDICINPDDYTKETHQNLERPTLPQLFKCPVKGDRKYVNISSEIGSKYFEFGVLLLNDETGSIVSGIEKEKKGNPEDINREIFRRWLMGHGEQPVTWEKLIDVLCDVNLCELATDIALH